MKYIAVLDCNNFFVSCERLFRPDLVGKPVVVLSSNDGCVVARSQEIKDMGIVMGVPYFQVKDILTKAHTTSFSSHFALYRDISSRVFQVVKAHVPLMEQYSIDEAFFTLTETNKVDAEAAMRRLKATVDRMVGIPVSIGVSTTKTQAKHASKRAKKAGGVVVMDSSDWEETSVTIALADIWGVGGRLSRRYREAGIETVSDLILAPKARIETLFGISGVRLQAELSGRVQYPVTKGKTMQKSILSSRSFKSNVTSLAMIKDAVAYHVRHAVSNLRALGLEAGYLTVSLYPSRHGAYVLRGGTQEVVFTIPTKNTGEIMHEALQLVERLFEPGVPYKKAGIMLGRFTPTDSAQPTLFQATLEPKFSETVLATVDHLNAQFGRSTVTLGRQTKSPDWVARHDQVSPAYTTNWSELKVVKA
jgi:DNA polymerase V